jgi:hypothetical protein
MATYVQSLAAIDSAGNLCVSAFGIDEFRTFKNTLAFTDMVLTTIRKTISW